MFSKSRPTVPLKQAVFSYQTYLNLEDAKKYFNQVIWHKAHFINNSFFIPYLTRPALTETHGENELNLMICMIGILKRIDFKDFGNDCFKIKTNPR